MSHKSQIRNILLGVFLLMMAIPAFAQQRSVKGVVLDTSSEPLVGASVQVQGTRRGTITDIDGKFEISAAANDKLVVSFLGFQDAIVTASSTDLSIVLKDDANFLEETVVVGYGVQKRATLTGAVSAVTNQEIVQTKNENVINMLSGKVSGVRITQNSSQPGEFDNNIDIRGMGSPLIVVDGVPRDQSYFSRMDSNEIESVSVLKDASAAVYGVRAANGVILVTTKHGSSSEGKFDIDFSANVGIQSFLYVPQTADAATHMLLINEKQNNGFNSNYPVRATNKYQWDQILDYSSGEKASTYWTDELFNKYAPQQQYNLSLNGSSDKIDYFFNLGYMDQEGSYKSGSLNYSRWNFRTNIDARITKRLRASVQLSGYADDKNQPNTSIWTVYKKAWTYRPTSQAWINGDHTLPAYDDDMLEAENPVATTDASFTGYRNEKRYNFNGSLALTYDIPGVEGLNAKAFYSYDYYTTDNTEFQRTYYLYKELADGTLTSFIQNSPGTVNRNTSPSRGNVLQLSLNYNHVFAEDHTVGAMVMYEESYNEWDSFYAQRQTYLNSEYLFAGESENQVGSMYGVGDVTRHGVIGKFDYDYKSRYIIDFAFRADASSRFPAATRWGFFPSVSAGWRISEEPWVKDNVDFITNLKLRGSWGRMGDDASAGTYPATVVGYNIDANNFGWFYEDGVLMTGVTPTSIPNPNLTWYTADTYNIGLDWNLWKSKFAGTVEFFQRRRSGLLATSSVVLPGTVGASMPQENIESDMTFGYEIELSHRNRVNEVEYWISGQVSATKNRWIYHLDSQAGNSMENWRRGSVSGRNKDIWFSIEEAGRFSSYDEIQNFPYTGTNYGQGTLPGDYYYQDWNGDGVIDGNDSHPVATYNLPVFNYGLTAGLAWKGIDMTMVWSGAAGIYNEYSEVFTEVGPFNGGAVLDFYTDRWHTVNIDDDPFNPNTQWVEGYYPATGHSFNTGSTGIKDTSYIRLKSLEIGYTFPKKWLNAAKIKQLRIYFNSYNLLTFSGLKYIDPERPGTNGGVNSGSNSILFYNYPVNRTCNIGVNLKF